MDIAPRALRRIARLKNRREMPKARGLRLGLTERGADYEDARGFFLRSRTDSSTREAA